MAELTATDLADFGIDEHDATLLLDIAETAIRSGLAGRALPDLELDATPVSIRQPIGAFVSLHVAGRLNGCIGHVDTTEPIAAAVAELALKAAFEDPRLPALRPADLDRLTVEISLLSHRQPVPARTRDELLASVTPFRHGLVLGARGRRALFLPSVWEQLPDPGRFVEQLLRKAGLPTHVWLADLRAERFTTATLRRSFD